MLRRLASALLLRTISRDLSRIARALDDQTLLLSRLAARFAPVDPPTSRPEVQADTGVSSFDPVEAILAQEYVERTYKDTGHVPDDDEILVYLADEKTTDLHKRLIEREDELARLREDRA